MTKSTKESVDYSKMPDINFSTFIFSLNSSALVHLGVVEQPISGGHTKNLLIAKQTIDIIAMLEEKTKGNLTDDEHNLIKNLLHELRLIYIRENKL